MSFFIVFLFRSDTAREEFAVFHKEMLERHLAAEQKISAIEGHIVELGKSNEANVTGLAGDTEAIKASYTSVEQEIKNVKIEATGKMHT